MSTRNLDLQRAALQAIHQQAAQLQRDQLADTVPPVEPPAQLPVKQPKAHHVVRWHVSPTRVTKLEFATREAADEHVATLHPAAIYKYAIMCGRDILECRLLTQPDLSPEEQAAWARSVRQ
jgi:hypothetical protein